MESGKNRKIAENKLSAYIIPAGAPMLSYSPAPIPEFSGNIPVFSITMNDYRVHAGIDIEAAEGSYVKSCASGIISNIYNDDLCATCISIDHGSGYVSCYRGLSDELPEGIVAGASVEAGTVIGTIDDGALFEVSQPAHLHFEMTVNGEFVDPLEYLPYNAEAAAAYYGE